MSIDDQLRRFHLLVQKQNRTMLLLGAFIVGVLIMVLVNHAELRLITSSFALIWSIPDNRPIVLRLLEKIFITGILFVIIVLACTMILQAFFQVPIEKRQSASPFPQRAPRKEPVLQTSTSLRLASLPRPVTQGIPQRLTQAVVLSQTFPVQESKKEPVTPIPPFLEEQVPATKATSQETNRDQMPHGKPDVQVTRAPEQESIYFDISLLKTLKVTLCIPGTSLRYPVEIEALNIRTKLLIAYIASLQGDRVHLEILREAIFGTDEAYPKQVQDNFSTAKREVRRQIDAIMDQVRRTQGADIFPPDLDLDLFANGKNKRYWLPSFCQVSDLARIDTMYAIIQQAIRNREVVTSVPEHVKMACDTLITTCSADFIETLLIDAEHFGAIDDWTSNWAREPFTLYRGYFLDAILYAAEYERKQGDNAHSQQEQFDHYMAAAELFVRGAMTICNSRVQTGRFDLKVSFNKPGGNGTHVNRSEQFARRAIALYGKLGNTILADTTFTNYRDAMQVISADAWHAHPQTLKVYEAATKQTGEYLFPEIIAAPYDLAENFISFK